jgi:hypothetical protein
MPALIRPKAFFDQKGEADNGQKEREQRDDEEKHFSSPLVVPFITTHPEPRELVIISL